MRPFRSLSARLTVQFALLFAAAMLAVSGSLSTFIAGSASRAGRKPAPVERRGLRPLVAAALARAQNAAQLLARDFGFRAAVASGDQATIQSALGKAAARLQRPERVHRHCRRQRVGDDRSVPAAETAALWGPLEMGG